MTSTSSDEEGTTLDALESIRKGVALRVEKNLYLFDGVQEV